MDIPSPFRKPEKHEPRTRRLNPEPPEGNPNRLPPVLVLESTSTALKPGNVYQTAAIEVNRAENGPGGMLVTGVTVYGEGGQMVYLANGRWEWATEETISRHLGAVHAAVKRIEASGALSDCWGQATPALRSLRDQIKNLERIANPLAFPLYEARYAPFATKPTIHNASKVMARLRGALSCVRYFAGQGVVRDGGLACHAIQAVLGEVESDLLGAETDMAPRAEHRAMIEDVVPQAERLHKALGLTEPARAGEVMRKALERIRDNEERIRRDTQALMRVTEDRDRLAARNREVESQAAAIARIVQVPLESLLGGRLVPIPFDVLNEVAAALTYGMMPGTTFEDRDRRASRAYNRLAQFFKGAKTPMPSTSPVEGPKGPWSAPDLGGAKPV